MAEAFTTDASAGRDRVMGRGHRCGRGDLRPFVYKVLPDLMGLPDRAAST